jgi:cell wall-associated NlpC family hydrolase
MHISTPRLAWGCLAVLFLAACTAPKETVSRYKYLIKEDPADNVATKSEPTHDLIREKAADMNIGERMVPVLQEASDYLGTPYRHGGSTKNGIDCSGLTQNCFSKAGVMLPRSAAEQSRYGEKVERKDLMIGDLVFFDAKSTGK